MRGDLAVVADNVSWRARRAGAVLPDVRAAYGIEYGIAVPCDDRVRVVLKAFGKVAVGGPTSEDAHDALVVFSGVLDLPADVLAVLRVRRNQHDHGARPLDTGCQKLTLDVVRVSSVVRPRRVDRRVADVVAPVCQQILQPGDVVVVFMDMAYENVGASGHGVMIEGRAADGVRSRL